MPSNSKVVADNQWQWQGDEWELVPGQVTDKVRWPLISSALCLLNNAYFTLNFWLAYSPALSCLISAITLNLCSCAMLGTQCCLQCSIAQAVCKIDK
jgi:hypothetical protein